ncbi:MAG: hypothetical protein K1X71_13420 [Pirellulales bacterium]|nr:hypothetical protein [Pirellulales bacterium]
MSQPDSEKSPGIYVPKARPDIYTVMLSIALAAVLVATVLMGILWSTYQ